MVSNDVRKVHYFVNEENDSRCGIPLAPVVANRWEEVTCLSCLRSEPPPDPRIARWKARERARKYNEMVRAGLIPMQSAAEFEAEAAARRAREIPYHPKKIPRSINFLDPMYQ